MKRSYLFKLAAIGAISLLLLIPLVRIDGLVQERRAARDAAALDIARGSGLAQTVTGPLLVVPVVRTQRRWVGDVGTRDRRLEETEERSLWYVLPERLDFDASLAIEQRRRGIYEARLYRTQAAIRGRFQLPARFASPGPEESVRFEPAFVALGVTDIRGIGTGLAISMAGQASTFQSGAAVPFLGGGVHAPLPAAVTAAPGATLDFDITLPIQGTGTFEIVPTGRETQVALRSPWPHPSFTGQFLPVNRRIDANGFDAQWQTSFFATNLEEITATCARRADCKSLDAPRLGVSLIDPVDQYLKSERAIK
jgi:inner membrane protein